MKDRTQQHIEEIETELEKELNSQLQKKLILHEDKRRITNNSNLSNYTRRQYKNGKYVDNTKLPSPIGFQTEQELLAYARKEIANQLQGKKRLQPEESKLTLSTLEQNLKSYGILGGN